MHTQFGYILHVAKMLIKLILLLVFVSDSLACISINIFPTPREIKENFKDCDYCRDCVERKDLTTNSSSDKIDNVSLAPFQIQVFNYIIKVNFQYPWVVSYGHLIEGEWNHICTGSIVFLPSEIITLTSQSCGLQIFRDSKVQIKMGAQFLNDQEEDVDTVSIYDINFIVMNFDNFAYVYTKRKIETNARTRPICMLGSFYRHTTDTVLENFSLAGWNPSGEISHFNLMSEMQLHCSDENNCPLRFRQQQSLSNFLHADHADLDPLDGSGFFKTHAHHGVELFGVYDHHNQYNYSLNQENTLDPNTFVLAVINYGLADICSSNGRVRGPGEGGNETDRMALLSKHLSTINPTCQGGTSFMHIASKRGQMQEIQFGCKWLERHHQNIIPTDDVGMTPIHEAYLNGHYEIARYLLQRLDNGSTLEMYQTDFNVTDLIGQINEMIDSTERGDFSGDPMEILNKLNRLSFIGTSDSVEMIAERYLRGLEILLDVAGSGTSSQRQAFREMILNEEIVYAFHKLSQMQNLTNETTNLTANVGTLLISKMTEHPGPGGNPTEDDRFPKSLYYVLKMFSNVPNVSMEVITNLREIGRCIY